MSSNTKHTGLYVGIDLGTTNSVISFSNSKSDGRVVANPIQIERKVAAGVDFKNNIKYITFRAPILPSCVYYSPRGIMVGDFARDQYKKYPESVVKSVKSQMGQPLLNERSPEITDKTPEQVSARILNHLKTTTEMQNRCKISDVIITVPANFDAAQREATMKAAELAGFDVNNPDGTRKQILISEPNAVLYDISQKLMNGEISSTVLDLSSKKKVLVFDIGGGTLDVTFHELAQDPDNPEKLNIAEIATSRYTRLAGDDFDSAIAQNLYERCIKKLREYDPKSVYRVEKAKAMVLKLLTVAAEQLKIDMSMHAEDDNNSSGRDWFNDDSFDLDGDYVAEVSQSIGDERIYNDTITKDEFESMIAPFMGYDYSFNDYRGYSSNKSIDRNNIIAPILDVLEKAERYYKKNTLEEVSVDAVILNGGMSKLYLIRDRLKSFFGFEPITTADPDLSVANGAAIYACIYAQMNKMTANGVEDNRRKNLIEIVRHIQSENLYIGLAGGASELLIGEGVELPYSTEISGFKMSAGCKTIEIPIKREADIGEMQTIARGMITFANTINDTTQLKIEASFDTTGLLSIKAHLVSEVGTNLGTGAVELALGEDSSAKLKGDAVKIRPRDGAKIDAKNYIHMLLTMYSNTKKRKKNWKNRINSIVESIENCGNPEDFEEIILNDLVSNKPEWFRVSLLQIALNIADSWTDEGKARLRHFAEKCMSYYSDMSSSAQKEMYQCSVIILSSIN